MGVRIITTQQSGAAPPAGAPTITSPTLQAGTSGSAYNSTLSASGGQTPYSWSATGLPAGLSIASSVATQAIVSGTPTVAGTFAVTVTVTGADGTASTSNFPLTINAAAVALAITTTSLPAASENVPYSQTLQATGGQTPYVWSETGLAAPWALDAAGGLTAVPTTAGTVSFTATVTDAASATATHAFSITVNAPTSIPLIVTPQRMAIATVGTAYSAQLAVSGGTGPYQWVMTQQPAGLSINATTGLISGTPTTATAGAAYVWVKDSTGTLSPPWRGVLVVNPAGSPVLAFTSLPSGVVGTAYSFNMTATGGTSPYTWTAATLPAGLTLSGSTISGTPTAAASTAISIGCSGASIAATTQTMYLTVGAAFALTGNFGGGFTNQHYSCYVSVAGGTSPYTGTMTSGPSWLTWGTTSGSGTPTAAGAFPITVQVSDSAGHSATVTGSITITATAALTIRTQGLPVACVGKPYVYQLLNDGGVGLNSSGIISFNWTATNLPSWATLEAARGIITGTPAAASNNTLSVQCLGADGTAATNGPVSMVLEARVPTTSMTIGPASIPDYNVGAAVNQQFTCTGGTPPYFWSTSPLPSWLSFNGATQRLTSAASTATAWAKIYVNVIDSANCAATGLYQVIVADTQTPVITTTTPLPGASVGFPYSLRLMANHGTPPYHWTVTGLPSWLTLVGDTLTSTNVPSPAATTSGMTISCTDSQSPALSATALTGVSITSYATVTILTTTPPPNTVGNATLFNYQLQAAGGSGGYNWSIVSGTLAPGLTLTGGTGLIAGRATAPSTGPLTIRATDSQGTASPDTTLNLVINPAPSIVQTQANIPALHVGTAFAFQWTGTGGTQFAGTPGAPAGVTQYTWVPSDSHGLPPGINYGYVGTEPTHWRGSLWGTPTTAGSYSWGYYLIDAVGAHSGQNTPATWTMFTLTVS